MSTCPTSSTTGVSTGGNASIPLSSPTSASLPSSAPLNIKPLTVTPGGWRPRFLRGGAPPSSLSGATLSTSAPVGDVPFTIRASSLPSPHDTNVNLLTDLPDRSHSATAPPPCSTDDASVPPLPRATSLTSPSHVPLPSTTVPTWSTTLSDASATSVSSTYGQQSGVDSGYSSSNDSFAMPIGSPTFYSQDSRPSPLPSSSITSLTLPRSSATFTKSPSRPHLLRADAQQQLSGSSDDNNSSGVISNGNMMDANDGSWRGTSSITPSHAAVTAHGLRHVQLDFQLLRQMRSDGVNGAYQIADAAGNRVIFKPNDEESFDVRTVPVSSIPAKDLAALPAIAKQAQAAGFRPSKELVALAERAGSLLKVGANSDQQYNSNSNNNNMNNSSNGSSMNSPNRGGLGGRRGGSVNNTTITNNHPAGGSSYVGHGHHATSYHNYRQGGGGPARLHHRRRRRGRARRTIVSTNAPHNNMNNNNNNNNALDDDDIIGGHSYTPPHIDTDDESSPSPLTSRRTSLGGVDDTKHSNPNSAVNSPSVGESDSILPSPPHMIAIASDASSTLTSASTSSSDGSDGGLSLVGQYMAPYLAPSQSMRMFKHDTNPCGPGVPRGVAWVSGRGRDLMLNIKVSPRRGVAYGDTTHKEWAAYLLDHGRFSGVPRTITASVNMYHGATLLNTSPSASQSPSPSSASPGAHVGGVGGNTALKRITSLANNDENGSSSAPSPGTSPIFTPESPPIRSLDTTSTSLQLLQPEPRYGSLQEFKEHICSAEDMGNSQFSTDEVHKIGILDLRLVNLDRHLGNILVAKVPPHERGPQYKLIPIDHGYILPDYRDIADVNFEWHHWKQCKEPFSATSLAFIASLDPVHDATLLKDVGVRNGSIITCVIATIMLQRAAAAGLTLCTIAEMAQRSGMGDEKEKSILERIVAQTDEEMANDDGCQHHHNHNHIHINSGNTTTDDELDDETIRSINNRGATGIRGRGSSRRGARHTRSWGRAFTKASRSAPLPTVSSSPPSIDDVDIEPIFVKKSRFDNQPGNNSNRGGGGGRGAGANRRMNMSLEDQMDDNVHFMGQPTISSSTKHHQHEARGAGGHRNSSVAESPTSLSSITVRREMEMALSGKKKNLLTSPMVNPMSGPTYAGVRPAPLLRHASDQVYQNGVGMTLMPDSESPALRPVNTLQHDDMESLSLDGVAARIGSPVTSPSKSRSLSGHGFVPSRSSRSSPLWTASSASGSPSTSPPSVSLFNRSNTTGGAVSLSSLFSSISAPPSRAESSVSPVPSSATASLPSALSSSISARLSSPASSPSSTPSGGNTPAGSPSLLPLARPVAPKSSRARPTISDGILGKKRSDTYSAPNNSNDSKNITISSNGIPRSRPLPIRAAGVRQFGSGPNSTVTSPSISPMMAASPPSPAAIPLRIPTPMASPPSDSNMSSNGSSTLNATMGDTNSTITMTSLSSPPMSPPAGSTSASSSSPSTPNNVDGGVSQSSSPIASTTPVLHSPSSPPSLSWHAAPSSSLSSEQKESSVNTPVDPSSTPIMAPSSTNGGTDLPRAALRASPSMELVRHGSAPMLTTHRNDSATSGNDGNNRPNGVGPGSSLPPVGEVQPVRRYAWNEAWLKRFMSVVTNAVDQEVSKITNSTSHQH